jgi:hypothetical protein
MVIDECGVHGSRVELKDLAVMPDVRELVLDLTEIERI